MVFSKETSNLLFFSVCKLFENSSKSSPFPSLEGSIYSPLLCSYTLSSHFTCERRGWTIHLDLRKWRCLRRKKEKKLKQRSFICRKGLTPSTDYKCNRITGDLLQGLDGTRFVYLERCRVTRGKGILGEWGENKRCRSEIKGFSGICIRKMPQNGNRKRQWNR